MSAERPQREVAYRLFAAEFEDSEYTYAESDEERAPNYVVTPTGARVNRLFVVGVLTEVEAVSDGVLRARIVDPTGAFVVYAGQYQPEALAFFERTDPPAFVAVTGKARTFQPDDSDVIYTSIRPESANEVTAETRDRWVVQTADRTIERVETTAGALELSERGDALEDALRRRDVDASLAAGIPKAIEYYGTTSGYLASIREMALDATRVVAGDIEELERPALDPDDGADEPLEFEYALPEPAAEGAVESTPSTAEPADEGDAAVETTATDTTAADTAESDSSATESKTTDTQSDGAASAESASSDSDPDASPEPETTGGADESAGEASSESASDAADTVDDDGSDTVEAEDSDPLEAEDADTAAADPDEMYELSESEREEVKSEYGVDFETGNEVAEPGEADIDAPEPDAATPQDDSIEEPSETKAAVEEPADEEDEPAETETQDEGADEPDETEPADETAEDAPASDVDLEDAVVEAMSELDDGDGAPRSELVETVADRHAVGEEAVEDAIQDALMGGRCYEPAEDRLTPI